MKKKRMTASELMAKLNADPAFVARRERAERERHAREEEWRRAERPLVQDLRGAGVGVTSAWDLVNTSASYVEVLPILLDHLKRPYPDRVREGIARALAVPEARFAWGTLRDLYRREGSGDAKMGLSAALAAIAHEQVMEDLIALVRDRSLGSTRVILLSALERSVNPRALEVLEKMRDDPELRREIEAIFRRRKR